MENKTSAEQILDNIFSIMQRLYNEMRLNGHSTPEAGLKVAAAAQVMKILFVHHAPSRTDAQLSDLEREIFSQNKNVTFAL